jgi:hypothetical protein
MTKTLKTTEVTTTCEITAELNHDLPLFLESSARSLNSATKASTAVDASIYLRLAKNDLRTMVEMLNSAIEEIETIDKGVWSRDAIEKACIANLDKALNVLGQNA